MDLVVHQVVELQHVHHTDGHLVCERPTRATVEQPRLPGGGQRRTGQEPEDLLLGCAIEYRRGDVDAPRRLAGELHDVLIRQRIDEVGRLAGRIEVLQRLA